MIELFLEIYSNQIYFLALERMVNRLLFYADQVPRDLSSLCMAHIAGGSNCGSGACQFCTSQRILRYIGGINESRDLTSQQIGNLLHQWDRLLIEPSILPYCFRLTGSDGFIYQIGRTFILCHQYDCLQLGPHSEQQSHSYQFEKVVEQTLGNSYIYKSKYIT